MEISKSVRSLFNMKINVILVIIWTKQTYRKVIIKRARGIINEYDLYVQLQKSRKILRVRLLSRSVWTIRQ